MKSKASSASPSILLGASEISPDSVPVRMNVQKVIHHKDARKSVKDVEVSLILVRENSSTSAKCYAIGKHESRQWCASIVIELANEKIKWVDLASDAFTYAISDGSLTQSASDVTTALYFRRTRKSELQFFTEVLRDYRNRDPET